MSLATLKCVGEVAATTEDVVSYTPANAQKYTVLEFHGTAAFSANSVVRLEWNGVVLWTIKGERPMPFTEEITDADGTKKLELICDNGEAGALYMSGYVLYKEI